MDLSLTFAAAVLVTGLVFGAQISKTKRKISKRERKNEVETERNRKSGSTKLKESKRKKIKERFERETGDNRTFENFRADGFTGYTNKYLIASFNIENLTTTASLKTVLDLAKLDLAEGAKPEEIVYGCCKWWPKKDVISAVIKETGAKISDILKLKNENGINCLIGMFSVLTKHKNATGNNPVETDMATKIEKSVQYLIELGEKQGLKMKVVLEKTDKSGQTLFSYTTFYSEKLASILLDKRINVKSINDLFMTPQFDFVSLHRPMIAAGVNPFALDHNNETLADFYDVSKNMISKVNPNLSSDLFYSTTSLPCNDKTCDTSCQQGLPKPWYYNNGRVFDFEETDRIGGGAEGTVFSGLFHGQTAAFKFVEIKNLKFTKKTSDAVSALKKRLSEVEKLSKINGKNILPFYGHIRQQLSTENVKKLGLGEKVTRYEVYITKKCDFNLADMKVKKNDDDRKFLFEKNLIDTETARNLIDQLIDAQEQLEESGVSHNDIKPENILVDKDDESGYKVFIGDFGQADQLGGTPGWTAADFIVDRVPGKTDMYSFGLVILFVLCENKELFYALRDNFIRNEHKDDSWYRDFLNRPVIKLISRMIRVDPEDRISSGVLKKEWIEIRGVTEIITIGELNLPRYFDDINQRVSFIQGPATPTLLEAVVGGKLDSTLATTALTQTHLQGDTCLCWLYSITSSLHQSMWIRTGKKF